MSAPPTLELEDIQGGVLRPRPSPYVATYIGLRIDDPRAGRAVLRRLSELVTPASTPRSPLGDTFLSVALTCSGFRALGLPQASLDSFAWPFKQGMAARASALGDVGESATDRWEAPLGSADLHLVLIGVAPDEASLEAAIAAGRQYVEAMTGITPVWRQDCRAPPDEKEPFGYRDGISHPTIEGSGIPGDNPLEAPLKAGELVLGYVDETGALPPAPTPDVLGRNGSYVAFRKLHQKVAAFRRFLHDNASDPADTELLAAKVMGRWRSGAPLALCPMHDDADLGSDNRRNNAFLYRDDDPLGYRTPLGSHVRRTNPRDANVAGVARLHRMIRRGTAYGPLLPEGVLEDDGADRGLMFAFVGAHLTRQFEFVQQEWINGGEFLGLGDARDPVTGSIDKPTSHTIPSRPIPRRLKGLSQFVVTRGGEYGFMPSIRALRWLGSDEAYADAAG